MESNGRKKKGWIKLYPVKWLLGSTRGEMTNAQRWVWIDFLSLAYLNDPPGQIDFSTYGRLAKQLSISSRLLASTINTAIRCKKIELVDINGNIIETMLDTVGTKRSRKKDETCQPVIKKHTVDNDLEKVDNEEKTIMILKWNEYQSEYLRQKPYRQRKSEEEKVIKDDDEQGKRLQTLDPEVVTKVTLRGEEKRRDKNISNSNTSNTTLRDVTLREENPQDNLNENPPPSKTKNSGEEKTSILNEEIPNGGKQLILQEYLARLGSCPGYHLDDSKDGAQFECIWNELPGIDILKELDKKILWWSKNPEALANAESPRMKLFEWFQKEWDFQNKGSEDLKHEKAKGQYRDTKSPAV